MSVPCGGDALDGVVGTGEGRDVRHLVLDGGLANSAFVLDGVALCPRRIDDEVHLLVQDDVEDVRAAFSNLVHHFALDAGLLVELGGAFGSVDLEAELLEFLADFDGLFRQVNLVGEANQRRNLRLPGSCSKRGRSRRRDRALRQWNAFRGREPGPPSGTCRRGTRLPWRRGG